MSSPPTVNCRGISLLKLDQGSSKRPGQEDTVSVSVHQLSLHLWELFKTPRGSIQKKINDLGIVLSNCSKESVFILREQCIIGSYKASQLTLGEAEKVFDAIQISRERRERSERVKQELAEKKWLQKMGGKKKNVKSETSTGQGSSSECREKVSPMGASGSHERGGQNVDGCALYRNESPPPSKRSSRAAKSAVDSSCESEGDDELRDSDCMSKVDSLMGVEAPLKWNSSNGAKGLRIERVQELHTIPSSSSGLLFMKKKGVVNGYPQLQREGSSDCSRRQDQDDMFIQTWQRESLTPPSSCAHVKERRVRSSTKCQLPSSPLSDLSEDSVTSRTSLVSSEVDHSTPDREDRFVYVTDSTDEENKECRAVAKKKWKQQRKKRRQKQQRSYPAQSALPKRVVVTKLRHFAKNTSPKAKTATSSKTFITPSPSIGKHLPLALPLTVSTETSNSTSFPEALIVSISHSMLSCTFDQRASVLTSDICSAHPLASSETETILSHASGAQRESLRLRNYKAKAKATALSTFVSKKRAATHTPSPPAELLPNKCRKIQTSSCVNGLPLDLSTSQVPLPTPGLSGKVISAYSQLSAGVNLLSVLQPSSKPQLSSKLSKSHSWCKSQLSPTPQPSTKSQLSLRSSQPPLANVCEDSAEIKKPLKTGGMVLEQKNIPMLEQSVPIVEESVPVPEEARTLVEDDHMSVDNSSITSTMNVANSSPPSSSNKKETQSVPSVMTNPFHKCTGTSVVAQSSLIDLPSCGSFSFIKLFDSLPSKLVVRNGELCPEVSLSLKGLEKSRLNDVPLSHPIWTWRCGQSTKKATPPSFKVRSNRQKSSKTKPPCL